MSFRESRKTCGDEGHKGNTNVVPDLCGSHEEEHQDRNEIGGIICFKNTGP